LGYRINIYIARLDFGGIYLPQMGELAWVKTILQSRSVIWTLVREGFGTQFAGLRANAGTISSGCST